VSSTHKPKPTPLSEFRAYFEAEGLNLLAATAAAPDPEREAEFAGWLDAGRAGEMEYLHRHRAKKFRPAEIQPGCRSILIVGLSYYQEAPLQSLGAGPSREVPSVSPSPGAAASSQNPSPNAAPGGGPKATGHVARYAWGRDYHKTLGKRLKRLARTLADAHPEARFRAFTDATPLSERHYAARAGLGFQGRNTLLITPELGSWFFIGEILTTLEVEETRPPANARTACPSGCRACMEACPTGAIEAPYRFDARRCISYLTIEHRGLIREELAARMGQWVFGCDRCQEVCPLNSRARPTEMEDFRRHIAGPTVDLAGLLALENDDAVRARYAGSPLLRPKRSGLVRNASIAAANAGAVHLLPRLEELSSDTDPVVAETAARSALRLRRR
jgi:epoxyqueuosine reductase